MSDGFLGRWSRRKLDVKQGKPVEAEPPVAAPAPHPVAAAAPSVIPAQAGIHPAGEASHVDSRLRGNDEQTPPPPTLEDVQSLTPESDFSRFAASDVAPEVKNAAMKKLFADPHFNVMDGLDVYIDDYTQPDPLPEGMLQSLASAEFLGFFKTEKQEAEPGSEARVRADDQTSEFVAQSDAAASAAPEALSGLEPPSAPTESPAPAHADPDLRLQQDHAPGPEGPGRGSG